MNDTADATLSGRRVLVALSGGIACYKTATLVSRLVQAGAQVRVIMTEAATRFLTPLTLQSLSGHPVLTSVWDHDDRPDSQHVGLARWCDAMVIAPCSADMLAKLAAGLTPDVVSLTASALPGSEAEGGTPLLIAPAMNADMWASPIVQRTLATLRELLPNLHEVGPESGWQACRTEGAGRMSEAEAIRGALREILNRGGAEDAETELPERWRKVRPVLNEFVELINSPDFAIQIEACGTRTDTDEAYQSNRKAGMFHGRGVYLIFNPDGEITYVGLATGTFDKRIWTHDSYTDRHWTDVVRLSDEFLFLAPALEIFLIQRLHPTGNTRHKLSPESSE